MRILPQPETWRYGLAGEFEVISNASDRETQRIVRDLRLFHQAVGEIWPAISSNSKVPTTLILCSKGQTFAEFAPSQTNSTGGLVSLALHDHEESAIVVDLGTVTLNMAIAGDNGIAVDQSQQLHREYIHLLLERIEPRPPAWLEEGLAQLFMRMQYSNERITFAALEDRHTLSAMQGAAGRLNAEQARAFTSLSAGVQPPSGVADANPDDPVLIATAPGDDKDFNLTLGARGLMPMDKMFAVTRDAQAATHTVGGLWPKQCEAFVHLCLYGQDQRFLKPFIEFVSKSAREPVTEELFRRCFNMSYEGMLIAMRGYIESARYKSVELTTKKGEKLPEFGPIPLREATEAEVGRIKGDALRLAGHSEAAHLSLIAPYVRGERDPQLLAAIGLDERAQGHSERAQKFLEAATSAHTTRARAYVELGLLYEAEALAHPAGSDGKLSAAQFVPIAKTLLASRRFPPPIQETYEGLAKALLAVASSPTTEDLALIDEGVRLFPGDVELAYSAARLWSKIGGIAMVDRLCDIGVKASPDAASRQRFLDLRATHTGQVEKP